jgi:hypothetical protein
MIFAAELFSFQFKFSASAAQVLHPDVPPGQGARFLSLQTGACCRLQSLRHRRPVLPFLVFCSGVLRLDLWFSSCPAHQGFSFPLGFQHLATA